MLDDICNLMLEPSIDWLFMCRWSAAEMLEMATDKPLSYHKGTAENYGGYIKKFEVSTLDTEVQQI